MQIAQTHRIFISQITSQIFGLTRQPLMPNAKILLKTFYFSFYLTPSTNIVVEKSSLHRCKNNSWDETHMECNVLWPNDKPHTIAKTSRNTFGNVVSI